MERFDFFFRDFQEGQPVEFLRVGEFIDAHGHDVEITPQALDDLVANFEAQRAGQEVPIDVDHERGEAAGWVQKIWREGDRLLARVDWNALGEELVGQRVYRYVSATLDVARWVLKSISLVNFPAVKGLRPVELSEGGYTMALSEGFMERVIGAIQDAVSAVFAEAREAEDEAGIEDNDQEQDQEQKEDEKMSEDELREQVRAEVEAELEEAERTRAELREQVWAEVEAELVARMERRRELAEFAEEVCGGEAGLAYPPDDLVRLMERVDDPEWVAEFQEVLRSKVVDFSERGSSREGKAGQVELDGIYRGQLQGWLDAGRELEEWFEINADVVGAREQYDLTEFEGGE